MVIQPPPTPPKDPKIVDLEVCVCVGGVWVCGCVWNESSGVVNILNVASYLLLLWLFQETLVWG